MASFLSTLTENIAEFGRQAKQSAQSLLSLSPRTSSLSVPRPTPTQPFAFGGGAARGGAGATGTWEQTQTTVRSSIPSGTTSTPSQISDASNNALVDSISQAIIELEDKLNQIPSMVLSDEEKEAFLQKAIAQISPYFDKKKAEIENGIETGKIRSAEDVLLTIRDVGQEATDLLKRYDIEEAQTEEDFINTLADITALEGESLDTARFNWTERVKNAKQGQVEAGVLTSGIGRKEVGRLLERQGVEEETIGRKAGQARTELETGRKYDLQKISLARETAERERVRRIGGPGAEAETTGLALETAGIPTMGELPSRAEIARRRGLEPITRAYGPEDLTDIAEKRTQAQESRKLNLQAEELAIRQQREEKERSLIQTQIAQRQRELQRYAFT